MRKKFIITVLLYTSLGSSLMYADIPNRITKNISDRVTEDVLKQISVKTESVFSKTMKKVFSANFYSVKLCINSPGSPYLEFNYALVYVLNNKLNYLQMPTGNQVLSQYLEILNKKFLLKTDSSSPILLQEALSIIEPVSTRGNKVHKIKHSRNKWTFIRSKFFENYSGYIFHTDDKGKIIKVEYSINL